MRSTLFRNASLHLGSQPDGAPLSRQGGLLVVHGRIAAVGERLDAPRDTTVIDLDGRSLLPGFQDAHVHPGTAGLALLGIDLSPVHSLDGYLDLIAAGAAASSAPVLTGVGWYSDVFQGGSPTAALLDSVVPDRPVILTGHDGHSTWVNSAALTAAGITASTTDPSDGVIVRDAAGAPTGVLLDGAMRLISSLTPVVDEDRLVAAMLAAQSRLHSVGITAWQDAMVGDSDLGPNPQGAYARLVASGELTGRVVQGLWWDRTRGLEQIPDLVERRASVRSLPGVTANVVKVMQDGMVENLTAAMLSPYCGPGIAAGTGPSFIEPALLTAATVELERHGFDIHFHAVGDRAVRECLDAVAAARAANGPTALRHQIAHLDVVDPADIPRFASLGVIANLQMLWARRDEEIVTRKLPLLGPVREDSHFPFGALQRAGARLAAGSDWPVSAPDPLLAVHTAVHRTAPAQDVHAIGADALSVPLVLEQALGLGTALETFMTGAAYANRLETSTGALRVGMDADLVVLDASLESAAAQGGPGVGSLGVTETYVRGEVVYRREA
ncbi:MAG: amidohydrolase [Galactobacter sp.]